jgi:Zn-dependent protease
MTLTCPHCGTPLIENDRGTCPVCRAPVVTTPLEPRTPGVIVYDSPIPSESGAGQFADVIDSTGLIDSQDEQRFQEASAILRSPEPPPGRSGLLFLVSLVVFVLVGKPNRSAIELAIIVGVLFFHELGHYLGMQLFGYQNVKMFFLPFFGAAVAGKKVGVPQWQEAIVFLLGPIPGLIVGCGLYFWQLLFPHPIVAQIANWLVCINAFNLLPLEPFDGGRFLNLVIFSRHYVLESVFVGVTSLLMLGLGFLLSWVFIVLGALSLCMIPARYRIARWASAIRQRWPVLPARVADAPEPALRDIFHQVTSSSRSQPAMKSPMIAATMRSVYERSAVHPVSVLGSLPLLVAYAAGVFLFFVWFIVWFVVTVHQQRHGVAA